MYTTTIIFLFFVFLIIGIGCNLYLFRQEQEHKQSARFLTSERFIVFVIEIMIAVIGFGVTLAITNANELELEKEKAIRTLEQTIEYTDGQLKRDASYLKMYNKGEITAEKLKNSSVVSINYYENVLSLEGVLQNAHMNTYGEIMKYLEWIEHYDTTVKDATEGKVIYSKLYYRYTNLKKVRDLLEICCDEMSGEISSEEAAKLCKEVKYDKEDEADKSGTDNKDKTDKSNS